MSTSKVSDIKRRLERGEYRVDPYAVADAIIHWAEIHPDGRISPRERAQNECSNPLRSSSISLKMAPAGPSTTAPIQVRPAFAA